MVKVLVGPLQLTPLLVNVGVTFIVAEIGAVPSFVAINVAMLPSPLASSPMLVLLLVQEYVLEPLVFAVPKSMIEVAKLL